MPFDIEQKLEEVTQAFDKVTGEVKQTADRALTEAERTGKLSAETKQEVDKLLTQQAGLKGQLDGVKSQIDGFESSLLEVEQRAAARRGAGGARQTLGQMVSADEKVKAFTGAGSSGTVRITVQNAITTADASAGALIHSEREREVVAMPRQQFRIRDLLSTARTTSNLIEYRRQTVRTNAAALVPETTLKPESTLGWGKADAPVRTIATWIHVSRQAMDDADQLQSEIDGELRYMLDFEEDAQILAGDGTGENLSGLITNATSYSGAAEAKIANVTLIDKLRVGLLEASLALYPADGIVLHPEDWMVVETTKDGDNRYIFANPTGVAGPVLWGRAVVPTQAMTVDKFLIGAFRMAATIYDRMDTEVLISSEDRDNFIRNMLTVRAEKRLALAVKRPAALVYGDLGLVA